jgi:diadenosine tetraphosphatase ApaH/serine/threonine PP2A family protein phosphatase
MGKTIVIGDIHGCYAELLALLDRLALADDDQVVAVGDLVVKGPENRKVLDLFMSERRFTSVIGNQDLALIDFWSGRKASLKPHQQRTLEEFGSDAQTYIDYLASLPFMIDLGEHFVVHAGVRPGVPLAQQSRDDLTELRTLGSDRTNRDGTPWYEVYDGERVALFGHWPAAEPRRGKRAIGLDTGCVYGYQLTAYILETAEFTSVRAKRAYDPT